MNKFFSSRCLLAAGPILVLAGLLVFTASGQTDDAPPHRRMENRFLFIIDTSADMRARTNGVQEAVLGLLKSDMKGELRPHDTIGLWTYNDKLDTDYPMMSWSEKRKDDLLDEVRDHLRQLHYEKRAHLDKVLPPLKQVTSASERLTIIFIFDGSGVMHGTPFDTDINDLHKKYARDFRAAHEPFVTVLAARNGAVFDYTINYPSSVVLPHTADPWPPPETNAPPPVVAEAPPPPPAHRFELVLSGTNHSQPAVTSAPPAAAAAVAAVTPPAPAPSPAPAPETNEPPPVSPAPVAVEETNSTNSAITSAPAEPPSAPPPAIRAAPAPAPVAVTPSTSQLAVFIMAFSLLTIAIVLVLFLVWRWKSEPPSSLITQSIDRSR